MNEKKKTYMWKRKKVTEKVYLNRLRLVEVGRNLAQKSRKNEPGDNLKNESVDDGRRIVHLATLADNLFCATCKEILSLQDRIDSESRGAATIFIIKCRKCSKINHIPSDKQHVASSGRLHFDINTKIGIGSLHSGLGNTQVNKLFAAMNIPSVRSNVFKVHEREAGVAGEKLAKDACVEVARLERELTIQNQKEIEKLLPNHLKSGFIIPNPTHNNEKSVVRFAASWDLGWSTRGTGRNYDSLNGFGALIGRETGKVVDFSTKQRMCRKCDFGHDREDHDCRRNFSGSAKAMEPAAAVDVTANSPILKECNMEIGILIGDEDSSTIAAVRQASHHEIVKFSDKNHISKGLTNELYKLKVHHKELTKDSIQYLHRCFTYALAQNQGLIVEMSASIRNIPDHCFNNHTNCGDWCDYWKDPVGYKHRIIGDGFKDQNLLHHLKDLFNKFADNSQKFVSVASSQANESLNATMASKAPKSRCYSTSESASFRYAYSVCQKNIGESYISKIAEELNMSPGKNTLKHIDRVSRTAQSRSVKCKKPEFKRRRLFMKKKKSELRNKKQQTEGVLYKSNMGLTNPEEAINIGDIDEICIFEDDAIVVVVFDLETTGFGKNAEIIQIGAVYNDSTFCIYINPERRISEYASAVHGITSHEGNLTLNGARVDSVTLHTALTKFHSFLVAINKKCVLTAHNCNFDKRHLLQAIDAVKMRDYFQSVIHGFCDTLPIIRKKYGIKGKGKNSIAGLTNSLKISNVGAHNAIYDVEMLRKIMIKLDITDRDIIEQSSSWEEISKTQKEEKRTSDALKNFSAFGNSISCTMKKKMISANITYEMILQIYRTENIIGLRKLFLSVTKSEKVISKIANFLESL